MKIKDWIVINYKMDPVSFQCNRCSDETQVPYDCPIDCWIAFAKAFFEMHQYCESKTEPQSPNESSL